MHSVTPYVGSKTAVAYALPSLILAPLAVTFYVFVPKLYAESGAISVKALGIAILLTRIWDAVTDPLVGSLSDRTVSREGRRKPWLKYSVLPLCLVFISLFLALLLPNEFHLVAFVCLSMLFFLFWTMYAIPYEALGQDLVSDYDGRTVLFSFRDGSVVIGTVIAALVPLGAAALLPNVVPMGRWVVIGLAYSVFLIAFTAICFSNVGNGSLNVRPKRHLSPFRSFREALANKYFYQLLVAYAFYAFGAALPATLFLFYVESVLQSSFGAGFLALYFFFGVLALPVWTRLAERFGKKAAWLAALTINIGGFLGVFFLSAGDELAYAILISISALGYGASLAIPSSMQADIIDAEELRTGERKEGEFLGVWSLAKKTSAAVGAGLALWVLGLSGFDAQHKLQEPEALLALRVLYCLVPCICSFAAILLMRSFSLSREEHQSILTGIRNRNAAVI